MGSANEPIWRAEHVRKGQEPGEFRATFGPLEIVVHRWIHEPGKWFVSCHRLGIDRFALHRDSPEGARAEAINHVRAFVRTCAEHLNIATVRP